MTDEQALMDDEEVVITIDDTRDPPPDEELPPPPDELVPPPAAGRTSTVKLQGKAFSPAFRDALQEMIRLVGFDVRITQGSFNGDRVAASAGTHAGDAVDFSVRGLTESQVAKRDANQTSSVTPKVDESKLPALIVEDGIFGPQTIRRHPAQTWDSPQIS